MDSPLSHTCCAGSPGRGGFTALSSRFRAGIPAGWAPAQTKSHREFSLPGGAAEGASPQLESRPCCFPRTQIPGCGGTPTRPWGWQHPGTDFRGHFHHTPRYSLLPRAAPLWAKRLFPREGADLCSRGFWGARVGGEPQPPIPAASRPGSRWNSRASRAPTRPLPRSWRSPGTCRENQGS